MRFEISPELLNNPASWEAGDALALWTRAGAWSAKRNEGGWVPAAMARHYDTTGEHAETLVWCGLWEQAVRDGQPGYQFVIADDLCRFRISEHRAWIPLAERQAVYARDGRQCVHCGSRKSLSIDHIRPRSLGGRDELSNYQTLCKSCNSRKGARLEDA